MHVLWNWPIGQLVNYAVRVVLAKATIAGRIALPVQVQQALDLSRAPKLIFGRWLSAAFSVKWVIGGRPIARSRHCVSSWRLCCAIPCHL